MGKKPTKPMKTKANLKKMKKDQDIRFKKKKKRRRNLNS